MDSACDPVFFHLVAQVRMRVGPAQPAHVFAASTDGCGREPGSRMDRARGQIHVQAVRMQNAMCSCATWDRRHLPAWGR